MESHKNNRFVVSQNENLGDVDITLKSMVFTYDTTLLLRVLMNILTIDTIINYCKIEWNKLPDCRKKSNNTQYSLEDTAMGAFSVFFFQFPSFLSHQVDLERTKGNNNARTLFRIEKIPTSTQIGNILDNVSPKNFHKDFYWLYQQLRTTHIWESFRCFQNTFLVPLDGVNYFSSENIHCQNCSTRKDKTGEIHYYHTAINAALVKPDSPHILPLPPEFICPQDGNEKQDCERVAAKRWLKQHNPLFEPFSVTFLGDDLYDNQPLCEEIVDIYQQNFLLVCKQTTHVALYEALAKKEAIGETETLQLFKTEGKKTSHWIYRWSSNLPLRAGADTKLVNWCELTIICENTQKILYANAWVTNHALTCDNIEASVEAARARWKIENEGNNTLKTKGYHLAHNFGHGQNYLSSVLFILNVFAYLIHTILHLLDSFYIALRKELGSRETFFSDVRALTLDFGFLDISIRQFFA